MAARSESPTTTVARPVGEAATRSSAPPPSAVVVALLSRVRRRSSAACRAAAECKDGDDDDDDVDGDDDDKEEAGKEEEGGDRGMAASGCGWRDPDRCELGVRGGRADGGGVACAWATAARGGARCTAKSASSSSSPSPLSSMLIAALISCRSRLACSRLRTAFGLGLGKSMRWLPPP